METKNQNAFRLKVRNQCYKQLGRTYNEIELFISNRFPSAHEDYINEWIERLCKPNAVSYMDNQSKDIWFSVLHKLHGFNKSELVPIVGEVE